MLFKAFSDGLWLPEGRDFAVPAKAILQADNLEYLPKGGVIGSRGYSLFASGLGGTVNSGWRHYPRTGTASTLVAVTDSTNSDFSSASGTSSSFSSVSGGGNIPGTQFWFANWPAHETTYLASLTSGLYEYDGSALATVSADGDNEIDLTDLGPYLTVHKARLWATKADELSFSVYASETGFANKFLSTGQISCNDSQGGQITGLVSFFGEYLIILKSSCLFRFTGDLSSIVQAQLAKYSDVGCIAPRSVAATDFGIMYVGRDGVYLTDGSNPRPDELSYPIRSLFVSRDTTTQYPNAVGAWYPSKRQYVLKLDPTSSITYVLQYVELQEENTLIGQRVRPAWLWSVRPSHPFRSIHVWDSENDDGRALLGDVSGNIWLYDSGTTLNGSTMTSTMMTHSRPIDRNEKDARMYGRTAAVYNVKTLHRAGAALSGALRYDQSASDDVTFSIGDSTLSQKWMKTYITDKAHRGRFVAVKLASTGSYNFEVHEIALDMRFNRSRVWRARN